MGRYRNPLTLVPFGHEAWRDLALCATSRDPDRWYSEARSVVQEAQAICAACPVRAACAEYGVENMESWGVWGGLTPDERREEWWRRHGQTG